MNSIIETYFKDIRSSKPLSKEEETDLALKAQNGDELALNKLITSNLRFVVTIARQYQGRGLELEDLIAEGNIGLIESVKRFDPTEGYRLISYSVFWIRQAIMSALNANKPIRLPVNRVNDNIRIHKVISKYLEEQGRKPTDAELSRECGISIQDVRTILRANRSAVSIDEQIGDDEDGSTLEEILANPDADWADVDSTREGLKDDLMTLLQMVLNEREVLIITKSFGLDCSEESDEVIAKGLNVSAERIRQIKLQALHKLRHCTDTEIMEGLKSYLG